MLDERVMRIADAAAEGTRPSRDDIVFLLCFDAYSPEAAYVCAKAREIGMRACGGKGYVFAQIGVDSTPCPENCRFCSFAVVNRTSQVEDLRSLELPIGRIVHFAKVFEEAGADLISLMATSGLSFERYLDMVNAVTGSLSGKATIMANVGDLTQEQADALKAVGVGAAYHAVRIGEGELTDIQPDTRRQTIQHLHDAGIPLMTGVEPLWEGADIESLAERMDEIPELKPFCMGACSLTEVEDAVLDGYRPALTGFVRYVAAITRLACGEEVPIGGIGGVAWVDAGRDPRERGYVDDDTTLHAKVDAAKHRLALDGFELLNPQLFPST